MSQFSGKCDLYDSICMEKTYDKGGYYESDEMECFKIFKEKTGGKIYQLIEVELTERNIEQECKLKDLHLFPLERFEHKEVVKDKRYKKGEKVKVTYTYKYNNKMYNSLEEINKEGYLRYKEIIFDTIFDIVPYYPYIITMSTSHNNERFIVISNESYVDTMEQEGIKYGYTPALISYYRKALQNHYKEIIEKYY